MKTLLKKKKKNKVQYHHELDKNISEEQKQKLAVYIKNYCLGHNFF